MKDELDAAIERVKEERSKLTQQVNDALSKLKRYNESKVDMSQQLADKMSFVRDLQKAVGEQRGDTETIASPELTDQF